jgi:hypothetical protein
LDATLWDLPQISLDARTPGTAVLEFYNPIGDIGATTESLEYVHSQEDVAFEFLKYVELDLTVHLAIKLDF